ncbi:unnamed protein product [Orchesella dallaii]|uniref:Uncharacterized protein n=1 Tax=Orchesella dallaii TaxID=48710 RepID=A0ABP1SAW0_9HEXA
MKDMALNFEIGIVSVNITYPSDAIGIPYEPILWSRPIPLAWYLLHLGKTSMNALGMKRFVDNGSCEIRFKKISPPTLQFAHVPWTKQSPTKEDSCQIKIVTRIVKYQIATLSLLRKKWK